MQRFEHLNWCKNRALAYVERNELSLAWSSMVSDINKNDETREHVAITLGTMLIASGNLDTKEKMKKFIEGFN